MGTCSAQKQQEVKTSLKSLSDPPGGIRDLYTSYLAFTPGGWCRLASDRTLKAGLSSPVSAGQKSWECPSGIARVKQILKVELSLL